jgi:tryptophan-rich sensory protein
MTRKDAGGLREWFRFSSAAAYRCEATRGYMLDVSMQRLASITLLLVLVVGGGLVIGFLTAPGEWYAGLSKPAFNPPNWIFAPVWSILYVLIAIAGWRSFERDRSGWPMKFWWGQLALNFLWSPVFFAAHRIDLALIVVLLLLLPFSPSLPLHGGRIAQRRGCSRLMLPG